MVIKQAELDIVCGITSKLPDTGMPEVAFAGKSNVGKSSLINGLMNRKSLAVSYTHLDVYKRQLGDRELEQMKKDMAVQKAVTLVADEAKEA